MASNNSTPPLPPATIEAMAAPRHPDAPRRCFICLTDEEPTDPPGSWVDPCPCTLEAHQDCMLSWVTDCERSNRPLKCPVCKSTIEMEGMWDPLVTISDQIQKRFSRASPFMLFTAVSMGIQASMQMYGAMALWTFSGKDVMMQYLLGPEMIIDGRGSNTLRFVQERVTSALIMTNVAPALLLAKLFPGFSNRIFLPTASLYGVYHVMHDDRFLSWPPSPQLAMAVFPYIRSIYYNMWREFVLPHEVKLNRQLLGLPATEPPREDVEARNNERRRQVEEVRNREPGILELLQTLVEALGGDEDDDGGNFQDDDNNQNRLQHHEHGENHELMLELVIEEVPEGEEGQEGQEGDQQQVDELAEVLAEAALPQPAAEPAEVNEAPGDAVQEAVQDRPEPVPQNGEVNPEPAQPAGEGDGPQAQNHEAPQAPARRIGLGGILSNVSNSIVSALILPGISFAAGEALKLVLPASWTSSSLAKNPWIRARPGLLQQQWGRSLVGGCLYVVLRDLLRVYTKSRKVSAMANRRVKNVDRPRRKSGL